MRLRCARCVWRSWEDVGGLVLHLTALQVTRTAPCGCGAALDRGASWRRNDVATCAHKGCPGGPAPRPHDGRAPTDGAQQCMRIGAVGFHVENFVRSGRASPFSTACPHATAGHRQHYRRRAPATRARIGECCRGSESVRLYAAGRRPTESIVIRTTPAPNTFHCCHPPPLSLSLQTPHWKPSSAINGTAVAAAA